MKTFRGKYPIIILCVPCATKKPNLESIYSLNVQQLESCGIPATRVLNQRPSYSTSVDIIKLLIDSPKAPCPSENQWLITLNMAVILDKIWRVRNHMVHHGWDSGYSCLHQTYTSKHCKVLSISTIRDSPFMQQCCSLLQVARTFPWMHKA